jgi:alkylated DNA repair protein (DNA oxidative demethylase)
MTPDLFADQRPPHQTLAEGVVLLAGFADSAALLALIQEITATAPFRHMQTPGGRRIGVAMSNCGELGWLSEPGGYRYGAHDPLSGRPWPAMPAAFRALAGAAAARAGFADFQPDACLINRYAVGTRLGTHRDQDERDFSQPIVSVSLGLPASFVLHGASRSGKGQAVNLEDGDVLVFGGPARLIYHSVRPLKPGQHPLSGEYRYNLTFRRAG